jgi:hypothetical protein
MKKLLMLALLASFLGSCAPLVIARAPFPYPEKGEQGRKKPKERGSWSLHALGIPKGHMPPPGSCRIWYPGRPPGQQPPPFKCGLGRLSVPLGAFLVQRLDGQLIQVDEYDSQRPDFVVRTNRFRLSD